MRLSTLTTTLATASLATARIIGIQIPSTLSPNASFPLTLLTEGYIQSVADVAVAWGFSAAPGYPYSLGPFTESAYLGPDKSNTRENITLNANAPAQLQNWMGQDVVLSASLMSLYGASGGPTVTNFNATFKVVEGTWTDMTESQGFYTGTSVDCPRA